jgi:hypothetical protein
MSQSDDSLSYSSLESNSLTESDLEENLNVKSCFEPYQGGPFASTDDSEYSDENRTKIPFYPRFWRSVSKRLFL